MAAQLSLIDLARRTDPNGDAADVAELLSQANDVYDDMVWKEGNTNTGHVFTVRTGIPTGSWRYLNQGIAPTKSTTAQGKINCGLLEAQSTIDRKLLEMADDPMKFRYEEDNAFIEGIGQTLAQQVFYGNALTNPAAFTGMSPYYNTALTANAANAANVINGGGSASNNASIWVMGWSPRSVYGVFPKGSTAGLKVEPLDIPLAYDSSGNPYRAAITWFRQEAGICVEDWRWVVRIPNLDVTSAGLGGSNPFDIFANGLTKAVLRLPKMARGVSGITGTDAPSENGLVVRPAIYCNRTMRGFMDIQVIRDKNVLIGVNDYAGKPTEHFRGVPIRVVDQLTNAESQVV